LKEGKRFIAPKGRVEKFLGGSMTNQAEMPLFTRTFDFITWLLPVTNNFPKAQRHDLRIQLG
jgi:hypothetical protein